MIHPHVVISKLITKFNTLKLRLLEYSSSSEL